jgi:hypothetical protein
MVWVFCGGIGYHEQGETEATQVFHVYVKRRLNAPSIFIDKNNSYNTNNSYNNYNSNNRRNRRSKRNTLKKINL